MPIYKIKLGIAAIF